MQKIRDFCTDKSCPAVLISQLDPKTTAKNACQSSLSYSSEFFRYADSCTYMFFKPDFPMGRILSLQKNRMNGKLLDIHLNFDGKHCSFKELSQEP
jgi:hypothetical protein